MSLRRSPSPTGTRYAAHFRSPCRDRSRPRSRNMVAPCCIMESVGVAGGSKNEDALFPGKGAERGGGCLSAAFACRSVGHVACYAPFFSIRATLQTAEQPHRLIFRTTLQIYIISDKLTSGFLKNILSSHFYRLHHEVRGGVKIFAKAARIAKNPPLPAPRPSVARTLPSDVLKKRRF
jgi:hypothetical protein